MALNRVVQVVLDVRDFVEQRVSCLRDGAGLNPAVEAPRVRLLVGRLVLAGLVDDGRWFRLWVSCGDGAALAGAVDLFAGEVDASLQTLLEDGSVVRRFIVGHFARDVACLVVEMAFLVGSVAAGH